MGARFRSLGVTAQIEACELLEPRTFVVCLGMFGWLGGLALWQVGGGFGGKAGGRGSRQFGRQTGGVKVGK